MFNMKSRLTELSINGKIAGYKQRDTTKNFIGHGSTKATNELFNQSEIDEVDLIYNFYILNKVKKDEEKWI